MTAMDRITREEIEQATDALCHANISELDSATENTFLLKMMLSRSGFVNREVAIKAAFHLGIRIGLQIITMRLEADRERSIQ